MSQLASQHRKSSVAEKERSQGKSRETGLGSPAGMPAFLMVQHKCANCQAEEEEERPVQHKCNCSGPCNCNHGGGGVHAAAADGVADAGRPLPHLDRIQSSFGRHDVGGTRVAVGGAAAKANQRMGSLAYTAGHHVGFADEPDVRLAAHEAAHVVQQRSGAKLPGGVGRPGDAYEQQADQVAEITARGGSAEHILDRQISTGETASPVVQHRLATSAERIFEPPSMPDSKEAAVGGAGESLKKGAEPKAKAPDSKKDAKKAEDPEDAGGGKKDKKQKAPGSGGGGPAQPASGQPAGGGAPGGAPPQPGGGPAPAPAPGAAGQSAPPQNGGAQSAPAPAPADGAPGGAAPGGGSAQPGQGPACTGKGVAVAYTDKTPDPRDQEQPPDSEPPATKAKEEGTADVPDVVEPDDCPADKALSKTPEGKAAGAGAPGAGGAAPANAPAGGAPAKAPGGAPGGQPAGPAAAAKGGHGGGDAAAPAPAPPTPPISIGSPLEGAVASAEGQRGHAAAAYFASSGSLEAASARTSVLRAGTRFGPGDATRAAAAAARADRFFGHVADQLDSLIVLANSAVPDRLGATAEAAKGQIAKSIDQQKSAISARVAGAKRQARAQAAGAIRLISARAAAVAANARTQTASALDSLKTSHTKAAADVDKHQTTTLARVNQVYADGRVAQEQLGVKIGDQCVTRGNEFAAEYEKFKINERDSIMSGHLTDRRAEAQMNASHETASGFRKQIIDAAKHRALDTTKAGRKTQRCAVIAAARASHSTLDTQFAQFTQALEAARDDSIHSAAQARDSQIASVRGALHSTLAQFDRQEHEQRQAADDTGFIQQAAQEQAAFTAASGLQQGVVQAVNEATKALSGVQAHFSGIDPPDPELLDGALSGATSKIGSMLSLLRTNLDAGAIGGESQLGTLSQAGLSALDGVTSGNNELTDAASGSYTGSIGQITAGAVSSFASMQSGFTKQAHESAAKGGTALDKAADGMAKACTNVLAECAKDIAKNTKELEANLLQNKQSMECEIPKQAMLAAAKEAPAWKKVLAVVLVILVVIIMIVATVVTFGAGGIVAGIIVGAIVGAVTSGMLYAASALWNNRSWSWGEFGKAVAIGALTGAIGGGMGAWAGGLVKGASIGVKLATTVGVSVLLDVGTQFFTHKMSFKDFSWFELGTTIVIAIVTFGIGHNYGGRIQVGGPKGGAGVTPAGVGETGAPAPGAPGSTEPTIGFGREPAAPVPGAPPKPDPTIGFGREPAAPAPGTPPSPDPTIGFGREPAAPAPGAPPSPDPTIGFGREPAAPAPGAPPKPDPTIGFGREPAAPVPGAPPKPDPTIGFGREPAAPVPGAPPKPEPTIGFGRQPAPKAPAAAVPEGTATTANVGPPQSPREVVVGGGTSTSDANAPRAMATNEPPGAGGPPRTGTVTPDQPVPGAHPPEEVTPTAPPTEEPATPAATSGEKTPTSTPESTPETPPAGTPAAPAAPAPPETYWVRMADGRIVEFPAAQVPGTPGHGDNVLFPDGTYGRVVGRGENFPNVGDVTRGVPEPAPANRNDDLNWGNVDSEPTYGHSFSRHGEGPKVTNSLRGRAAGTGQAQGQWLDNEAAAQIMQANRQGMNWARDVDIPPGLGQVIMPDGTIVPVTRARIVPSQNGGIGTSFPIL
jgi:hypothetical protein